MLNAKMYSVATAIEEVIIRELPTEYQVFLFDGKLKLNDLVMQILVECCKYAHDSVSEKRSLRFYLQKCGLNGDDQRMVRKRTLDRIQDYREMEYEYIKQQSGIELSGLIAPDMGKISDRKKGYQLTDFQFWEINNVHDMQLVGAIINRRLDKKNFTKEEFVDYANERDCIVSRLRNRRTKSMEDEVFSSLALFTLEWKYSFDFYYELATEMENTNTINIPDVKRRLTLFCGNVALDSVLRMTNPHLVGEVYHINSRMLIQRRKFIHSIVSMPAGDEFEALVRQYAEALVVITSMLLRMTYRGIPIREWFVSNSTAEDWGSVFSEYDVFQAFISTKDWTSKRIRYVRDIYSVMSMDYKNPAFRS